MKLLRVLVILLLSATHICAQTNLNFKKLGRRAFSKGEYTAAAYFLYADYLRDTVNFEDYVITAFLLANEAEYDKAERMFSKVSDSLQIEQMSDSLRYYYCSGLSALAEYKHDYVRAINLTRNIEQTNYHYELRARCYESLGLYEHAVQELLKLQDMDNVDKWKLNILLGEVCRKAGDYDTAISYYLKAKELSIANIFTYYALGWTYELKGDDETALSYYDKGISLIFNNYAYIYLMRGELYLRQGKTELAKKDFEKILQLDKKLTDGSCRHYALHFLGRDSYALEWMERIISADPNDPGHYYDKACLYGRMGRLEDANKALETAFEKGYRAFAHIEHDDDMDPIRSTDKFKDTISKYYEIYEKELSLLQPVN